VELNCQNSNKWTKSYHLVYLKQFTIIIGASWKTIFFCVFSKSELQQLWFSEIFSTKIDLRLILVTREGPWIPDVVLVTVELEEKLRSKTSKKKNLRSNGGRERTSTEKWKYWRASWPTPSSSTAGWCWQKIRVFTHWNRMICHGLKYKMIYAPSILNYKMIWQKIRVFTGCVWQWPWWKHCFES
jgi:hypothetical protein